MHHEVIIFWDRFVNMLQQACQVLGKDYIGNVVLASFVKRHLQNNSGLEAICMQYTSNEITQFVSLRFICYPTNQCALKQICSAEVMLI